jgi:hypothetical protein
MHTHTRLTHAQHALKQANTLFYYTQVQNELPLALKALRIAEMARDAAKALPLASDIPITDTVAAKALASTVKATETACSSAQKSVNDLVKFAVSALVRVPFF